MVVDNWFLVRCGRGGGTKKTVIEGGEMLTRQTDKIRDRLDVKLYRSLEWF